LRDVNDVHRAQCSCCFKGFDIGNMGESALKSHAKGYKHMEKIKGLQQNSTILDHWKKPGKLLVNFCVFV
jgi:hypothetical protein